MTATSALGAGLGAVWGAGVLLVLYPARGHRPRRLGLLAGSGGRLRLWLVRSGGPGLSPTVFVCASAGCGVVAGAVAQAVFGVPGFSLAAACAGAASPCALVSWRGRTRRVAARAAWPDIVDHLVAAVRSGIALPEAVSALATLGSEGLSPAFERFARDYRSSGDFVAACDVLKAQLADPVFDRIAETLKMAREVGGTELVGVLRGLAAALREDAAARGELRARQTWVVNAARLGVAAPWLVLAMLTTRPEGREAYGTPLGTAVIAVAAVVTVVAYRVMIAIGRLPEERRWFR